MVLISGGIFNILDTLTRQGRTQIGNYTGRFTAFVIQGSGVDGRRTLVPVRREN